MRRASAIVLVVVGIVSASLLVAGPVPAARASEGATPVGDAAVVVEDGAIRGQASVDTAESGHEDSGGHDDESGHGGAPIRLSCGDIDPTWVQLELKGHPVSGTHVLSDSFRTVTVVVTDPPVGGKVVDWHSDGPIDAVILRSGQDAATYEYEPAALGDTGLVPPLKDREGRYVAAVVVCYDPADPIVGLDLVLVDSDDPVEVGDAFDYRIAVHTSDPLEGAEVVVTVPTEVDVGEAAGCTIEAHTVRCSPPLGTEASWEGVIAVSAVTAGNAIATAELTATAGGEEIVVSSAEVTRIIGPPGSGCGGHDDGGHEGGEDECGGAKAALTVACTEAFAGATVLVLEGPFANRNYRLEGPGGVEVTVTIGEGSGHQSADWVSTAPIDAFFTRTGREIASYVYDPATFAGVGLVGPAGGSGEPRPMVDLAACYVTRDAVDVGVRATAPEEVQVGGTGVVAIEVRNAGYLAAEAVEVHVRGSGGAVPTSCASSPCILDVVEPGGTVSLEVAVEGVEAGPVELEVEVVAPGESAGRDLDNVVVLSFVVADSELPTGGGEPVTPDPGTEPEPVVTPEPVAAELPETGAGEAWPVALGTLFLAAGIWLVRVTGR